MTKDHYRCLFKFRTNNQLIIIFLVNRDKLINLFPFEETLDDHFEKPSKAPRKAGFQVGRRSNSLPDITMEHKSPGTTTAPSSTISFNDPPKKSEQEYSLLLRKNLPKLISKYQN